MSTGVGTVDVVGGATLRHVSSRHVTSSCGRRRSCGRLGPLDEYVNTLIFRKVADVRREKELAERRKNEPQLDQAQDHLVRKIFSRFRRDRQHTADVEKGDGKDAKDGETSQAKKLSTTEEGGTTVAKTRPGKWGRLLGSSSLDTGSESGTAGDAFKRSLSARDSRPSSSAGTNKVFPKLGKLGERTIEESGDNVENQKDAQQPQAPQQQTLSISSKQLQLRRLESYDGGLITQQPSHEREVLAAVLEVKVDLKLEVQRTMEYRPSIATTSTSTTPSEGYREQSTATERISKSGQEHHHHHHHHHQSSSSRDVSKELLERLAQASTSRGDDSNALGPLILRKRRSKSRNKGAAPLAPLATQPMSPSEATETTQMLECTDDRDSSSGPTDRTVTDRTAERPDRKRPPPRPREYL
ncbi:Potassium voltage-gated channel protein eag [Trachymyrmex cornetzi]|uniref:Potassium voltage-gated channel protein eag n=1 Tax=Trachymyrmex cornetzi TaxID=471704 RepID=A0A195D7T4_9HYME|nr:Potassium voltage-gated channel protein eag [Trachymyrmex cornetzi]